MTRTPEDIARLFAYSRWANAKVLESVSTLTPEELGRPVGGSFSTVLGTLTHVYGGEWVWLERFLGRSPRALPPAQEIASLGALREKWREVEQSHKGFVEGLTTSGMTETLRYTNFAGENRSYPIGELLVHLANHSTYHRGQVTTLLRQLGKTPTATDYLLFLDVPQD